MSKSHSLANVAVGLTTTMQPVHARPKADTPFCVAILGDFSGRTNRGLVQPSATIAARRPILVDRDNLDATLAQQKVEIILQVEGQETNEVVLRFNSLDDFHPDRIFQSVKLFEALRGTRSRLKNPATFGEAAEEVRSWARPSLQPVQPPAPEPAPERSPLSVEGLFDEILDETQAQVRHPAGGIDWVAMVREIAAPYSVPGADPQLPQLIGCVDSAIAALMRAIMHHPDFQAIEASWRALDFLVRRVETDAELKLCLIDLSKAELAADLGSTSDLRQTGLYKLLVDQTVGTPGGQPWAVLLGNYTFQHTIKDADVLARLGLVAQHAGAPFLAAAHSNLVGCDSLAETPDPADWNRPPDSKAVEIWMALRSTPQAKSLGLALPKFLLRLPYGKKTDPVERFDFEELPNNGPHGCYLWGNPAFACTCLLAQAFAQQGWHMQPNSYLVVDGLPAHVFESDGESEMKPCAEVLLVERAMERIAQQGIMPLLSIKGHDSARLASFFSLAGPGHPLASRWEQS